MKFSHPLEALRHHVTGAIERGEGLPIVEKRDTVRIACADGSVETVPALCRFSHTIDGREFNFAVTPPRGKNIRESVTHVETGARVCDVAIAGTYTIGYHVDMLADRGKLALDMLVDKHGANRVCVVIASAKHLEPEA